MTNNMIKPIFKKVVNSNGIFTCDEIDITVEEWKKVLQDSLVYNNYKLWLARFYQEVEHKATCKYMGEKYKCSSQTPNSVITKFGIATRKILNRFEVQGTDGSQTYWIIPMKKGRVIKDLFEWTMRDELVQAMEELGMTNPEDFEEKLFFTWIPFYTEMAEKLLEYKDNRKELVKIVYGMDRQFVNYIKDDAGNDYPDIDPFSVFAIFNRKITDERRKDICQYFKNVLQLDSDIPEDFDSIPVMNPQLSVFVWREEISTGIQPIWDLYETVFENNYNSEKFLEHFNIVRNQRGIKWTLTMALYWIRPYEFMPLDSNSREYLQKIGINVFDEKDLNCQSYLDLCKLIKEKIVNNEIKEKSIPEISYNAWLKEPQGDTQMAQEDTLVKKYANLLKNTKNLILTGAPGTGKTYLAKQIAKELGCKDDNIGFVQFHPSYDYTDFVEGLRPTDKDGNGNVGFERRDGVFKKFCEKAILPSSVTEDIQKELNENPTIWKVSLERTGDNPTRTDCLKNGYIRLGWSNYGDVADFSNFSGYTEVGGSVVLVAFQSKMKVGDIVLSCYSATEIDAVGIVTGDYEYRPEGGDYPRYRTVKWIVKGIKENIVEKNHGKTLTLASVYKLSVSIKDVFDIVEKYSTNQTLSSDSQEKTSNSPYVFIIDEINRGEVAKIFGELFYCVDPGYRGKEGKINTQYQNLIKENNIFYSGFFIPENVYIIGTMNDIDRSVESMDFAFRRRFTWAEVKAKDTQYMLDAELDTVLADEAKRRMDNLNAAIWSWDENKKESKGIDGLNDAYHIGASYFLKLNNYGGDFGKLWDYHIKGILQEYLRGNPNAQEELEKLKAAYDKAEELKDGE